MPVPAWLWHADYDVDIGFGAARSDGSIGGRWTASERVFVGAAVSLLENIYEFKVGKGRVLGVRLDGGVRFSRDVRAVVDGGWYAHRLTSNVPTTDWSQRRFSARLEWTVGRDPGTHLRGLDSHLPVAGALARSVDRVRTRRRHPRHSGRVR